MASTPPILGGAPSSERPAKPTELAAVRAQIDGLVRELQHDGRDVNVVVSGPMCIGAADFCEAIESNLTRRAFRFAEPHRLAAAASESSSDVVKPYGRRIERLYDRRRFAMKHFAAAERRRAVELHTCDLLRERCVYEMVVALERHEDEAASAGQTPDGDGEARARLRLFHQNPEDHAVALARASRELGYLDEHEAFAIEMQGEEAWSEASRALLRPSTTVFVYVQYDGAEYDAAYADYVDSLRKSPDDREALAAFEALQPFARLAKRNLDQLYATQDNDIVKRYFSIVLSFVRRDLLSPLHSAVACREILTIVRALQAQGMWGDDCNDHRRAVYLATSDWLVHRVRPIPALPTAAPDRRDTERHFRDSVPPLPAAVSPSAARPLEPPPPALTKRPAAPTRRPSGGGLRAVVLEESVVK